MFECRPDSVWRLAARTAAFAGMFVGVIGGATGGLVGCQPGNAVDSGFVKGSPMVSSAGTHTADPAPKSGTGQMRTDAEPVLKRFPLLGRPQALKWMSGTMGDSRVPGPSTYWIDVIADLPADHVAWLRQTYALPALPGQGSGTSSVPQTAQTLAPEVKPDLKPELSTLLAPGGWQTSSALDAALSQQGFVVRAYLQGNRLVLATMGQ